MSTLTTSKKAKLQEVADGLLEIYRTLARMEYLDPAWILEGPHDLSAALQPTFRIPGLGQTDHISKSEFADFRDEKDVKQGRDPMYLDTPEGKLRPWQTPLSMLGNHGTVIIYDAREHSVGMYDQKSGGDVDYMQDSYYRFSVHDVAETIHVPDGVDLDEFLETRGDCEPLSDENGARNEDSEEDDEVEENEETKDEEEENLEEDGGPDEGHDSEDNDESDGEDEESDDGNEWAHLGARPAKEVLRDIKRWYEALIETPGGGESTDFSWDADIVIPLYRKHGWPSSHFDGTAFTLSQERADEEADGRRERDDPIEQVQYFEGQLNGPVSCEKERWEKQLEQATDENDKRLARLQLFGIKRWEEGLRHELEMHQCRIE